MQTVALVVTLALMALMIYAGYRDGVFVGTYALLRNLFAFMLAMTLFAPLTGLLLVLLPGEHPKPLYYQVTLFALVFGAAFALARWLKIRFTKPRVPAYAWVDRIAGTVCGLLNGIVVVGVLLILWSLMPFAKFIPGDFGRIEAERLPLDAGAIMLRFYDFTARKIPGGRTFLLEDVQRGGKVERGWLWRYRNHADFSMTDLELALPAQEAEAGPEEAEEPEAEP